MSVWAPFTLNRQRRRERGRGVVALKTLKWKIAHRRPLTPADERLIARCGPNMLAWLGIEPKAQAL